MDSRLTLCELFGHHRRSIGAVVIDHEHIEIQRKTEQSGDKARQILRLIVCRHHGDNVQEQDSYDIGS